MGSYYVATKSVLGECGGKIFLCILFCWLIVPIFIMIYMIVKTKSFRLEFHNNKVIMRCGVFNIKESQSVLTTIVGVRINRTLPGKIFNYGDIFVDMVGRWDIDTTAIKNPESLKNYLACIINQKNTADIKQFITN